jgi:aminoglycoside N3'-acetyltransferase
MPAAVELLSRGVLRQLRRIRPIRGASTETREGVTAPAAADLNGFLDALGRLHVRPGSVLMVHSSSAAVSRLGWQPHEMLDVLLSFLGPAGTLAMPSHPGLSKSAGREIYDVRRSASTVGLLSEVFRRRKGVLRSRCPLSAASATGPEAARLVHDHALSFAPHDENSPYAKLAELDGTVLCLGCPLNRMTILHVAEDVMRRELPIPGFHQPREIWVRDGDREDPVTVHERAAWLWWYLHMSGWNYDMYRQGLVREVTWNGVTLYASRARDVVDWMKQEIRAGRTIYPLARSQSWLRLGDPEEESART